MSKTVDFYLCFDFVELNDSMNCVPLFFTVDFKYKSGLVGGYDTSWLKIRYVSRYASQATTV